MKNYTITIAEENLPYGIRLFKIVTCGGIADVKLWRPSSLTMIPASIVRVCGGTLNKVSDLIRHHRRLLDGAKEQGRDNSFQTGRATGKRAMSDQRNGNKVNMVTSIFPEDLDH
jgi:hypothetical protein